MHWQFALQTVLQEMVSGMEEDLKSISSQPQFEKSGPFKSFWNINKHSQTLHIISSSDSMARQSWTPRLQELEVRLLQSRNQDVEAEVPADRGTVKWLKCFTEHRVCFSWKSVALSVPFRFHLVSFEIEMVQRNELLLLNWAQLQLCWTRCTTIPAMNFALHATGSKQLT